MDTINENEQLNVYPNGTMIADRFQIESFLAAGGMAQVYVARQLNIDRLVAMKVLSPMFSMNPSVVMRFFREARVIAQLSHPNTVRLFDMGETPDKRLYMAMELLEGAELSDRIRQGRMKPEEALPIVRQVAGSLSEAHSKGIIHRDLKPDNIFLTKLNIVKVLDFGIAKLKQSDDPEERRLTKVGTAPGTPEYMSPEQARGKELDARSDLYSLGVVLYEMLAGHPPFEEETFLATILMHVQAPPPPLPEDIPVDLRNYVVNRLLAKDPNCRPDNADCFVKELDELEQKINPSKEQALIDELRTQLAATKLELLRSCEQNIIEEADADRLYRERVQAAQIRDVSVSNLDARALSAPQMSPSSGQQEFSSLVANKGASVPPRLAQTAMPPSPNVSMPNPSQSNRPNFPMPNSPNPMYSGVMGAVNAPNPNSVNVQNASNPMYSGVMGAVNGPNPNSLNAQNSPNPMYSGVMGAVNSPNPNALNAQNASNPMYSGVMGAVNAPNPNSVNVQNASNPMYSGVMGAVNAPNPNALNVQNSPNPMYSGVMGAVNAPNPNALNAQNASNPMYSGVMGAVNAPNPNALNAQNASNPMYSGVMGGMGTSAPRMTNPPRQMAPMPMPTPTSGQMSPSSYGTPSSSRVPESNVRAEAPSFSTPGGDSDESIVPPSPRHLARSRVPTASNMPKEPGASDAIDMSESSALGRPRNALTGRAMRKTSTTKSPTFTFMEFAQPLCKSQKKHIQESLSLAQYIWNASILGPAAVTELFNDVKDNPNLRNLVDLMLTRKEKYFSDFHWRIDNMKIEIDDRGDLKLDFDAIGE